MSALESTFLVHVNNLPYTQDGVVIYLTIDMFQFTDVTASYVFQCVLNNLQSIKESMT